jgi:hypothetical protein
MTAATMVARTSAEDNLEHFYAILGKGAYFGERDRLFRLMAAVAQRVVLRG